MSTRPDKIKIVVTRMLVARAEVTQLCQVVTQSVRGALHQVVAFAPGERCKVHFEFQMRFQVSDAKNSQATKDLLTCPISDLSPILFSVLAHVPDRNNCNYCVLSLRRHGWDEPGWSMDIKTRIRRQIQVTDDRVEVFAAI